MAATNIPEVLSAAIANGHVSDDVPAAIFYDMTALETQCKSLVNSFPPTALHGFAVKACPVVSVIRAVHAAGLGAECASIGEVALSLAAGVPPASIIFDSPAKTDAHLRYALSRGIHVNADNIEEVARIAAIRAESGVGEASTVGLRVNPQLGTSKIALTFTASASSKFGVPLTEERASVVAAFREYPFLSCVHVHVGSQGCAVDVLVRGAVTAVELADEINSNFSTSEPRVTSIDVGGGLSVDYDGDSAAPTFEEYTTALRETVPGLFARYRVLTEFGRKVTGKAAWVAARVQHVKHAGGRLIALGHTGADIFMRPVYQPEKWHHRIDVMSADGKGEKGGEKKEVDVAGPLCFSGDLLAVGRMLPVPEAGDWFVVRDAGAYTLSALNRHTSQLIPPVYGYDAENLTGPLKTLMRGETMEDLVKFWS